MFRIQEVTIGVMTWNSIDILKLFFTYLERYTPTGYKVIVINNGSIDGTKEYLDSKEHVVTVHNKENLGVIKALQQTERLLDTKYFVSMNDDILVSENWLTDLLDVYDSDNQIGSVSPFKPGTQIVYPYSNNSSRKEWEDLQIQNPILTMPELIKHYTHGDYDNFITDIKAKNTFGERILECPFKFTSGCCVLVETERMKEVGGFVDGRFGIYGAEDIDRCWRLGIRGYKVVQTGKVFVHHIEGVSLKNNKLRWKQLVKKNNAILIDKWAEIFWKLLEEKIEMLGSLELVVEEFWIVQWLLESIDEASIPPYLRVTVKEYLRTRASKLS